MKFRYKKIKRCLCVGLIGGGLFCWCEEKMEGINEEGDKGEDVDGKLILRDVIRCRGLSNVGGDFNDYFWC